MSFAAQLAARAEATTKRTSSSGGGSSIGSPPQSQSSLSESIKNRVSASSTTEQSTNNKQPSTTSGWKPKQQQQKKKKKNKKKLVPISPEASPIIDSSYRDVETRHMNNNTNKQQPQDVTNNNNNNNSHGISASITSILPTTTEEESKRMSFGSAIKAANKISSSRENSKDDDGNNNNINEVVVEQSQSIPQAEQSNTTTTYKKKDSSSSSEQRLSTTTQALDTQLDLSIENLQLQSSLHDIQTKYKALELQLNEKKKDDKGIITTTQTQTQNLVYTRKSSDAMSSIGGSSGWNTATVAVPTKTGRGGEGQLQRETSGISVDVESFVTHDELMEENVRLTQLILDVSYLLCCFVMYVCCFSICLDVAWVECAYLIYNILCTHLMYTSYVQNGWHTMWRLCMLYNHTYLLNIFSILSIYTHNI